ncbi:hypothetical protein BC826DRAFT_969607 [Russula brevipes]|nr:hypothetical protein BC826DRAFT_969607 [Russula brevipes]
MTENWRPSLRDTRTLLDVIPRLREEVCRITRPERFARFSLSVDTQTLRNSTYKHAKAKCVVLLSGRPAADSATGYNARGQIFIKRGLNVEDDGTLNERAANERSGGGRQSGDRRMTIVIKDAKGKGDSEMKQELRHGDGGARRRGASEGVDTCRHRKQGASMTGTWPSRAIRVQEGAWGEITNEETEKRSRHTSDRR